MIIIHILHAAYFVWIWVQGPLIVLLYLLQCLCVCIFDATMWLSSVSCTYTHASSLAVRQNFTNGHWWWSETRAWVL